MNRTEFLTGHKPERYKALLQPLVEIRTQDMYELLSELRMASSTLDKDSFEYDRIKERYMEVDKAVKFWIELQFEGDVIHEFKKET